MAVRPDQLPAVHPRDQELAGRPRISFRLSRQIVLRGIALVYLAAFLSMAAQADGLIGRNGLLPVGEFLAGLRETSAEPWRYPTLLWFNDSDAAIDGICLGGAMAATLVALGLLQMPLLAVCYVLYLSVVVGGQAFFLDTPWDALLLEAGFLAVFIAPWQLSLRLSRQAEPPVLLYGLLWWLLFRVLLGMGISNLTWDAASWRDGSALRQYFQVQPLPVFTSWYAARLPPAVLTVGAWALLFAQILLPFAVLCGRYGRRLAFLPLAVVQIFFAATGNFGVLNYLLLILCLALLDDDAWAAIGRGLRAPYRWAMRTSRQPSPKRYHDPEEVGVRHWRWPAAVPVLLATAMVPLGLVQMVLKTPLRRHVPEPLVRLVSHVAPFGIVNGYALSQAMPSDRIEMVIEGSRDGIEWRPYEFRYKPGDVTRRPGFCAPHMPRLDWQMATLRDRDPQQEAWFQALLKGLLESRPKVASLLLKAPFDADPPMFLRVRTFGYRYSLPDQLAEGYWWRRELLFDSIGAVWLRDRQNVRLELAAPKSPQSRAVTGSEVPALHR